MPSNRNFSEVRTRFAPSPTGYLHIGNLRTALFSWLIAKKYAGKFILRIEDTDQKRLVPGSVEKILEALEWLGISPDEGVIGIDSKGNFLEKGDKGPYFQSQRLEIYQKFAQKLVKQGKAYYCFCTPEQLKAKRELAQKEGHPPMYDGCCKKISLSEAQERIKKGEKAVIRMAVPKEETIEFEDLIYGKIKIKGNTVDDQVLIKSDGFPTYHLAVVVDDHLMEISHVVRGEDWIPSAPKHILLYQFFGWKLPVFIHLPNVLGENKKKLSKRAGDVSVSEFVKKGYLPEALVNFLALLGWNPKDNQEIFSKKELLKKFDEKNLHRSGAIFNSQKLDWMNGVYIRQKESEELWKLSQPFFEEYFSKKKLSWNQENNEKTKKIVAIEKERIKKISDLLDHLDFYFFRPCFDKKLLKWKDMKDEEVKNFLLRGYETLEKISPKDFEVKFIQEKLLETAGEKRGELLWPLRVALSGRKQSPSPFEIAWVLGKKETLERIKKAIEKLEN